MRKFEITDKDYNIIMAALERYRDEMGAEVDAAHRAFEPTPAYLEWINTCITIINMESQA